MKLLLITLALLSSTAYANWGYNNNCNEQPVYGYQQPQYQQPSFQLQPLMPAQPQYTPTPVANPFNIRPYTPVKTNCSNYNGFVNCRSY